MEEEVVLSNALEQEAVALENEEPLSGECNEPKADESLSDECNEPEIDEDEPCENADEKMPEGLEKYIDVFKDAAISYALTAAGAKNVMAAKALIDKGAISFDTENCTISGIDSQIEALKSGRDTYFLFERGNAYVPQEASDDIDTGNMSYKQLCEYYDNI